SGLDRKQGGHLHRVRVVAGAVHLVGAMQQFVERQVEQRTYLVAAPVVAGGVVDHGLPAPLNGTESVEVDLQCVNSRGKHPVDAGALNAIPLRSNLGCRRSWDSDEQQGGFAANLVRPAPLRAALALPVVWRCRGEWH